MRKTVKICLQTHIKMVYKLTSRWFASSYIHEPRLRIAFFGINAHFDANAWPNSQVQLHYRQRWPRCISCQTMMINCKHIQRAPFEMLIGNVYIHYPNVILKQMKRDKA